MQIYKGLFVSWEKMRQPISLSTLRIAINSLLKVVSELICFRIFVEGKCTKIL